MSDEECERFLCELELKFSQDKDHLFKVVRYAEYYRGFKSLNSIDDPLQVLRLYVNYKPSIAKTGRVYHTFASMPRQVRKCLRTKSNELIWEVDMSSAQPSIIFLEWLKWSDFNDDLSYLSLSGSRVKSKRNRHVPVPLAIRKLLVRNEPHINIFSGKETPYNNDYFKTLFRRFKRLNNQIDNGVTLYSFRHSGAIEIYKRTSSLTKLQKAMGHSSINVSLTYLRGLEIAELKEEDMPMV
jgi:integrase